MNLLVENKNQFRAKIFKALADPSRLEMLLLLGENERCVCEIVDKLDLAQPAISRHLKILRESGIVRYRKDGNKRLYQITDRKILRIVNELNIEILSKLSNRVIKEAF